jgi:toxin ParE1/3/4
VRRDVVITGSAERDLQELHDWIEADRGSAVAERFLAKVTDFCAGLAHFPYRGRVMPGSGGTIHTLAMRRVLTVAYAIFPDRVEVLRVLYRGRDVRGAFPEQK